MLQKKTLGILFGILFTINFSLNLFNLYEITVGAVFFIAIVSFLISVSLILVVLFVSILFRKISN